MDIHREIADSDHLAVLSGAGISAGSNLPTYRGPNGLYSAGGFPPLSKADTTAERLPRLWQHIDALKTAISQAHPSAAHHTLARFAHANPDRTVTVITQNIDGLHHAAGSDPVLELHGNLQHVRCTGFRHVHDWDTPRDDAGVPRCPTCGGRCRPDVVLFGEHLNPAVSDAATAAAKTAQVLIVIGTSLEVSPANSLVPLAQLHGARVINVNLEASRIPGVIDLVGTADDLLPDLLGAPA